VTHDAERREIAGGGLFAADGIISRVGVTADRIARELVTPA
jgi:hypothetical protein